GHLGGVSSVAFSPDAKLLVSGGSDKTIRLWDVGTGQLIRTLEGHENAISKVLFSPNEIHIASSSFDKTVRIWSAKKGDCETTLRGHSESVIGVAYSPCGNRLVSSSEDGTIRMWNPRSGSAGPVFRGHTDHVVSVAYSPDGKQFASCGRDMELRLWDCRAATKGAVMFGRTNGASSEMYPYSTVKRYGNDGYKTIHPTLLRRWVDVVFDSFPDRVTNVTVSPDGTLVASASRNVVNVRSKATQRQLKGHTKSVNCIVFSPDPQLIASGSSDKTTRVWNAHSGALVIVLEGHKGVVTSIAFSSAGHQIVTGSKDGTVRLWNLATGEALNIFGSKAGADILSVAFSSNGKWIASGGEDGDVRIWDAVDYKGTPHVNDHGGVINCIIFSPDNIHIASGSDDGTIIIWNMDTKNTEHIIRHDGAVKCLAYSPTGDNIASGGDDQYVRIWNAETGVIDSTLDHRNDVLSLCYSADGTRLWTGSANYKAYAWSKVPVLRRTDIASNAEFSENCQEVVWSPGGKDVQLWNMDSGALKSVLKGHTKDIESVSFSLFYNIIATASRDGMVKLWDSQTGECLANLKSHAGEAAKIMFSPNGLQIATCGGMKVRLWNLSITKSESPSEVGEQCTPPQPGRSSSKASDQSKQQTYNLSIVATELFSYDFNAATSPVFSPDGKEVSAGTADDVVLRYATHSGEALAPLSGHAGIVTCIDYSLLGDMIATGGEDRIARIWSREKGELKLELNGHRNRITCIAFSPCSNYVATGSADKTICLWSSSLRGPGMVLAGEGGSILCLAYSPDGRFLISGCENRLMRLWDPSTGVPLTTVGDFMVGVKSIRWKATPGGLVLLTGCDENPLRLWELVEGGGRYMIQSRWGARVDTLAVFGASVGGGHGLDSAKCSLLSKKGVVGIPSVPTMQRCNDSPDGEDPKRSRYDDNPQQLEPQMRSDPEDRVRVLRDQFLESSLPNIYTEPRGYKKELGTVESPDITSLDAPDPPSRPLVTIAQEFLDGSMQVLLIVGDPGLGKSYFVRQLKRKLWEEYGSSNNRIPLLINLQDYSKTSSDLLGQVLEFEGFNPQQIQRLKGTERQFVLICDGYDEAQATFNIYNTNNFNTAGQWRVKLIIACRSDKIGLDSECELQPDAEPYTFQKLSFFQMAVIVPFTLGQIKEYVDKYVAHPPHHNLQSSEGGQGAQQQLQPMSQDSQERQPVIPSRPWSAKEYMDALKDTPNLMELLLPLITPSTQDVPRSVISLDVLFKHIFVKLVEAGKQRLASKDLHLHEDSVFGSLLDYGFEGACMEYQRKLSFMIFKKQRGDPVYLFSLEVFDPDDVSENGSTNDEVLASALDQSKAFEKDHKLGVANIANFSMAVRFLADRVQNNPVFKKRLVETVRESAHNPSKNSTDQTLAANAMTILVRSGMRFNSADLRGIKIQGANLTGGEFDSADLRDADLRNTTLDKCWLRGTRLEGSLLTRAKFGELPSVLLSGTPLTSAYSSDGKFYAVSFTSGRITVFSTFKWEVDYSFQGSKKSIDAMSFSPNSRMLAYGDVIGIVRIRENARNIKVAFASFQAYNDFISDLAFSPDGLKIATASIDHKIGLWDAASDRIRKL
ncbi:hypothetical protein BGX24_003463, partial [Mortierella sp. AD032]